MVLDLFRLDGRTAVVTGARQGLGRALAVALAQAGADIVGIDRQSDCDETAQRVRSAGRKFLAVTADLADPARRAGLLEQVASRAGRVDILVNVAGNMHRAPAESHSLDAWQSLLDLHLTAVFDLSQQAARLMLPRGRGKIVNIGSMLSFQGGRDVPAYAAAKHGVAGLTKALAGAWAGRGINVNCLAPGYFETDLAGPLQDDPVRGPQILDRIPCGRWGDPDELAGAIVFLASDASNYVHGSVLVVDGGWQAR